MKHENQNMGTNQNHIINSYEQKQIINIVDAQNDDRFDKEIDNNITYITTSLLSFPLFDGKNNVTGVVQCSNKKVDIFNQEDENNSLEIIKCISSLFDIKYASVMSLP